MCAWHRRWRAPRSCRRAPTAWHPRWQDAPHRACPESMPCMRSRSNADPFLACIAYDFLRHAMSAVVRISACRSRVAAGASLLQSPGAVPGAGPGQARFTRVGPGQGWAGHSLLSWRPLVLGLMTLVFAAGLGESSTPVQITASLYILKVSACAAALCLRCVVALVRGGCGRCSGGK